MNTIDISKSPFRTNYFERPGTWLFRGLQFSIAVLVLYLVDLNEMSNGLNLLYVCSIPLAILFIVLPVDDLAMSDEGIRFIRRSLLSGLDTATTYQTSKIKRIGFASISGAPSLFSLFVPVPSVFRIEFTFQDDSSQSNDISIRKKDLQDIVSEFRRLQKDNDRVNQS